MSNQIENNNQKRVRFISTMEHLLEESVSSADLKRFETRYHEEMAAGKITPSAQFEYAWCLVRSKYPADIRKGILLLEDLYQVRFQPYENDFQIYSIL